MDEKFTQLETLRKASWDAIVSRREYEWRVSIAFWTLLGGFIAALVTTKIDLAGGWSCLLLLFPIILGAAHLQWLWGLFRAYTIDKKEEEAFRAAMRDLALYEEPNFVTNLRGKAANRSRGILGNWNHAPQVWTTIAFTVLATYVAYKAANQTKLEPVSITVPSATAPASPAP